jgi:hypothetical protein
MNRFDSQPNYENRPLYEKTPLKGLSEARRAESFFLIFGDSSFSATTLFHALDIPHEITD